MLTFGKQLRTSTVSRRFRINVVHRQMGERNKIISEFHFVFHFYRCIASSEFRFGNAMTSFSYLALNFRLKIITNETTYSYLCTVLLSKFLANQPID